MSNDDTPEEFLCPLSLAIMDDPVSTVDGQCYDRTMIEAWLQTHDTSPLTGKKLEVEGTLDKRLIPNYALRNAIQRWLDGAAERFAVKKIDLGEVKLNMIKPVRLFHETTEAERAAMPAFLNASDREKKNAHVGSGQDKSVFRGFWQGRDVAVLQMRNGSCETEARVLALLGQHPHCCGFFGVDEAGKIIINELAPMGCLADVLESSRASLLEKPEHAKVMHLEVMHQVCSGMFCISSANLIHRDLAVRNVVVSEYDVPTKRVKVKVTDFGLSRIGHYYNAEGSTMPIRWSSPEALLAKRFSEKSDVWSFGVVVWELLDLATHIPYWEVLDDAKVMAEVGEGRLRLEVPGGGDADLWAVADKCLQHSREARPTFEDLQVYLRALAMVWEERQAAQGHKALRVSAAAPSGPVGLSSPVRGNAPEQAAPSGMLTSRSTSSTGSGGLAAMSADAMEPDAPEEGGEGGREQGGGDLLDQMLAEMRVQDGGGTGPRFAQGQQHSGQPGAAGAVGKSSVSVEIEALRSGGQLTGVLSLLRREIEDASTVEEAVQAVLFLTPTLKDGVPIHLQSTTIQNETLVPGSDGQSYGEMVAVGTVSVMVMAVSKHQENLMVAQMTCRVLCCLASHPPSQERLGEEGAIECVLLAMRTHRPDAVVQESGCWVLWQVGMVATNKKRIASGGGVSVVISAMRAHPNHHGVQDQGCGALRVLAAAAAEIQAEIARQCGISVVVGAMLAHPSAARLQERGCGALWNLALLPANQPLIAQEDGVRAIVGAMGRHQANAGVQKRGSGALRVLSLNLNVHKTIVHEGGIEVIVSAVTQQLRELDVVDACLGTLRNLATNKENAVVIAKFGGLSAVINSVKSMPNEQRVATLGLEALCNLTRTDQIVATATSEGSVEVVVQAMRTHAAISGVQDAGCGTLTHLAQRDQDRDRIGQAGGIEAAVAAMTRSKGSHRTVAAACVLLRELGRFGPNQERIAAKGGVNALLNVLMLHPKVLQSMQRASGAETVQAEQQTAAGAVSDKLVGLMEHALAALRNVAASEQNQVLIAQCGGVRMVTACMRHHRNLPAIQELALGVLYNLAFHPQNKDKIPEFKGLEYILGAMLSHPSHAGVQTWGCNALRMVALNNAANLTALVQLGGVKAVMLAMQQHPTAPQLMESALTAIRILRAQPSTDETLVKEGGIRTVLLAMQQHMPAGKLVQEGTGLLASLAVKRELHGHIVHNSGVKVLLMCMFHHASRPEVQLHALMVLRCVTVYPEVQTAVAAEGGVRMTLLAMKNHSGAAHVQENAIAVLLNLAQLAQNRAIIAREGGITGVLLGMHQHAKNGAVQEFGCGALCLLARGDGETVRMITDNRAIPIVQAAMQRHPDNPRVQQYGAALLGAK